MLCSRQVGFSSNASRIEVREGQIREERSKKSKETGVVVVHEIAVEEEVETLNQTGQDA
jgi:hypothetical protein